MTNWGTADRGLRMDRLRAGPIRGGLLSVEGAAALAAAGFEPVCEVLGAVANRVTASGVYPSAARRQLLASDYRTYTSSTPEDSPGTPPVITVLKAGYHTALGRLRAEASAAGADGVVGVRLTVTVADAGLYPVWNFIAIGTAVRATGPTRARIPFTTDLSAAQTAAAIRGGWVPVSYLVVPVRAIRVVDPVSVRQRLAVAANGEVDAYADVVTTCRSQAAKDFGRAAAAVHADGAVLSAVTRSLSAESKDVVIAQVTVSGTALARFDVGEAPPGALSIIPLKAGIH